MATIREGQRGALLVVDVQVGVVAQAWQADTVIARIAQAVERARAQGVPVQCRLIHASNGEVR